MKLLKKPLIAALQIMVLFIFAKFMNVLAAFLHLRIPGTILGILVIFLLLHFKIIQLKWIELGAVWLLGELLLFFIPSAVGVIDYGKLLSQSGTSIILVVLISTFVVMLSTGIMTQMIAKRKERKKLC
ncbi:CidA/LrgA family holin-like protein [Bacillus safensis]|uniref:CidA/LrgA family holin-like protein n=1 Tax=Bacillus TaxID=1386 RepID=UPI0009BFF866|nr:MULTISPECIES: CidA/LrgA family holin-like protein [Bacillus]MBW4854002.1 CidA/LrgA family holin-like protein [Bacillaceae bacterium]MBI1627832.1 CidA/LrgA family holin-like protein [Bacillus safensis]MBU5209747.1 CidA/LrgA family holin-like protein [Bacillus safensis]MBW4857965.1 CidA/LrgA family holin-like protein [Bacillaceae bacterium]RUK40538.1 CidA/LrgA family holin-like protein [Bacillus safensis]